MGNLSVEIPVHAITASKGISPSLLSDTFVLPVRSLKQGNSTDGTHQKKKTEEGFNHSLLNVKKFWLEMH